ncbi:hypothetical protein M413DRAFT_432623 [Hebeloma cylindrosporum]|uniref:Uncharacterized protein n=1 Tax=Hebeloma cylindrosporum TaxID=76867 RepID=A0A0C3CMH8_HEBCY|nr:hypothetical protein M413DRAFT_432623 [Hebeloma cylindrosporum h7]
MYLIVNAIGPPGVKPAEGDPAQGDADGVDLVRVPEGTPIRLIRDDMANLGFSDVLLDYDDIKVKPRDSDYVNQHMSGPGETTVISEVLFDFMGKPAPFFGYEDVIMDCACDLIDFEGELDVLMENIEVSSEVALSDATSYAVFTSEPVPMDVDSYDDQVRKSLVVSLRNLGLDIPAELGDPTRPVKKVNRKATRTRASGLHNYSRPTHVLDEFGSKSSRTGPVRQVIKNVRHSACDKRVPPAIPRVPAPPVVAMEDIVMSMASPTLQPSPFAIAHQLEYNRRLSTTPGIGSNNYYDNLAPSSHARDYFNT